MNRPFARSPVLFPGFTERTFGLRSTARAAGAENIAILSAGLMHKRNAFVLVGLLIVGLGLGAGVVAHHFRARPKGALDRELSGVSLSRLRPVVPARRRRTPVTNDGPCWNAFGADPA